MDLLKIRIMDTYLFKFKWLKRIIIKVQFKGECPKNDISRLEDYEGVKKNMKIGDSKERWFYSLVSSKRRRILGGKLGSIKKFPKNSLKYW